ncbi:rhodanese-like domain-containing protein [Actinoplanes sp. LDG1-06]|uniref:Rhodanese-like domain-containing protein n=1 Tax=Paractinoplanes ovalisporus TaxID=2810368 RepID=A0ABS2AGM4_9ACTN|nr:rhodanese-like domain-containing protein [Actinoplanes ovalisporus]MBM2618952.1 rhodanese-like domain-containing protein [Actinoplanes ovalisporus]
MTTISTRTGAAVSFFEALLAFQTDVSDVRAALSTGAPGFVLIDSRARPAWDQAHIPGALHLPTADIPARARELLDPAVPVVTYCWGPGCNGATRAALALARLGYDVREMIGGIEYWIREGFPVLTPAGEVASPPDPRTAPVALAAGPVTIALAADACGC